jgi:hypothetical protein
LRIVLILLLLAVATTVSAQDSLWAAWYGGSYNENGYSATRLTNGDFLLIGSTFSYGSGDHDIYLIKVDSTGTEIWSKTFGGTGTDYGYDIAMTADSGFVIIGSTTSSGNGGHDVYLLKVDNFGILQWSKTIGGADDDIGSSIRMTADSGFIICGTTESYGTGTDMYLIKTDSVGDTVWTKTHGGASGESGSAVRLAADSGYIVLGSTGSYGTGYSSVYLVRTGSTGDTLWTATYGGNRADFGYGVETTNDKGYIISGATALDGEDFYDAYLVKVDSFGVLQWSNTYGGSYEDRGYSVKSASDGGYIMTGTKEGNGARKIDIYMVKTDAGGNLEWDSAYGGAESDYGRTVLLDTQGDYHVVGYSFSAISGGSDVCFLKIQGPVQSDVDDREPAVPSLQAVLSQNYPNPFNLQTSIEFLLPRRSAYRLTVYNVLGQVVRHWENPAAYAGWHSVQWDGRDESGSEVASGLYLYRLQNEEFRETRKMILLK